MDTKVVTGITSFLSEDFARRGEDACLPDIKEVYMSIHDDISCSIDGALAECQKGKEKDALHSLLAHMKNNLSGSASEEELVRIFCKVAESRGCPLNIPPAI